jgi:hypothetical protein
VNGQLRCYSPLATTPETSHAWVLLKTGRGAYFTLNDTEVPGTAKIALDFTMTSNTTRGYSNGCILYKTQIDDTHVLAGVTCTGLGGADITTPDSCFTHYPGWSYDRPLHVEITFSTTAMTINVFNVDPNATGPASYTDTTPDDADTAPGGMLYHIVSSNSISASEKIYLMLSGSVHGDANPGDRNPSEVLFDNVYANLLPAVAMPTFTVSSPAKVAINCTTPEASIYYTINGPEPSSESTLYTGPVTVTSGQVLRAVALAEGYSPACNRMTFMTPTIPIVGYYGVPFGWSSPERFREMEEAGFSHSIFYYGDCSSIQDALDSAQETGIKLFVNPLDSFGSISSFVHQFQNHPAFAGYRIFDEPVFDDFNALATQVQTIQSLDPDHLCYINLFPYGTYGTNYQNYVDTFLRTVLVKVLSFDNYPITTSGVNSTFYKNLEIISKAAKDNNIPFWAFALSTAYADIPDVQ